MKRGKKFKIPNVNWRLLIFCLVIVYAVAVLGSLLTTNNVNSSWYESIKPPITPPNWVFPLVWNILFLMISLSLYFALLSSKNKKIELKIKIVFGINLLLNLLWSFFYFFLQNPLIAFVDLLLLFASIVAMIFVTWRINKKSAWLLVPYIMWISFAGILNYLSVFV